jgi:hypothetical protein
MASWFDHLYAICIVIPTSFFFLIYTNIGTIIQSIYLLYVFSFINDLYQQLYMPSIRVFIGITITEAIFRWIRNVFWMIESYKQYFCVWKCIVSIWFSMILFQMTSSIWLYVSLNKSPDEIVIQFIVWISMIFVSHLIELAFLIPPEKKYRLLRVFKRDILFQQDECFICTEQFNECIHLDCGHRVHEPCLEKWISQGRTSCPFCRSEIV